MKTVEVQGAGGLSHIHVGEQLQNVKKYLPDVQCIIITDQVVRQYHGAMFPDAPVITIGIGEGIKTLATVEKIFRELIELGADRSTFILGIGGGIVCDITGFVASTYMRGLRFGFVSTTLLSQVDASVGGKNGVNLDAYKNMVGVFCQPEFVICDPLMLPTLPPEEVSNGFAEIVKHGLIADAEMVAFIEDNVEKALSLDKDVISRLVLDSVRLKAGVVQRDEREAGERKKLNFGHTLGHALEKLTGMGHGKAVSIGMVAAAEFSRRRGYLDESDCNRIKSLLDALKLPVSHKESPEKIMDAMFRDKKKQGNHISFVFLNGIGQSVVEKMSFEELEKLL
ncbi:3-dehydroquinate synthase [Desulfamplus magnetovallimortis]|uniref:3-dehydroquinate synthase n=1 Tax=Desulfamplus magnetovallimortis TaxID=1246637 RepID=A0A1W1H9H8_9BACT|nr:3-dehydroquinate synthase [Desulfamplus magnetovallimortis]